MIRNYVFNQAKGNVLGQTKGLYPAPIKILEAIKTGLEKGPQAGFEAEAQVRIKIMIPYVIGFKLI